MSRIGRSGAPLRYRAFGVRIESDVPLPGLVEDRCADPADARIWLASKPPWVDYALALPRSRYRRADIRELRIVHMLGDREAQFFCITYADGTEFVVSCDGGLVFGKWPPPLTLEDTLTYVMGPILGIVLRRLNWTCLHASAVVWNGRSVIFVGRTGAGKSTTAAAAIRRHGARMLTDDIVALRRSGNAYLVQPGQSWVRLWESAVRLLFDDEAALPLLTPNWDKRYLDATPGLSPAAPLDLICFLGGLTPIVPDAPALTPVSPRDALVILTANTYGRAFVRAGGRRDEFRTLSDLAQEIPAVMVARDCAARPLDGLLEAVRDSLASASPADARRFLSLCHLAQSLA